MTDSKGFPETGKVTRVNNRVVREGEGPELGLKAQRRDTEAFTSRSIQGDGEWPIFTSIITALQQRLMLYDSRTVPRTALEGCGSW